MKYRFCGLLLVFMMSCNAPTSKQSEEITRHFQSSGRTFVNLDEVVQGSWERVCILGPYSDNTAAQNTLGFAWDIESKSSIATNDSLALLLFVKSQKVVESVEHPRNDGDFTNLSRQCFARDQARFVHKTNPKKGWPGLFPKS